jgi:hypothetical protein
MKPWEQVKTEPAVIEFITKNENLLFGDVVNGDTDDSAISILVQVYEATKDGYTSTDLNENFFYSHNGDNEPIEFFSCNEICNIMGITPILIQD